jgi:bacillithiol system protein YtxJ
VAKKRLEKNAPEHIFIYYLDLLSYRQISNEISSRWNVVHQSPQLLKIENDICTHHANHLDINPEEIA